MGDWVKYHSDHWQCNKFEELKTSDTYINEESKRDQAKSELNRYIFAYERFVNHQKSEEAAERLLT